ncbi:MAG: hypothetical protein ACM31C_24515 [Acidobacteriota bacterium]
MGKLTWTLAAVAALGGTAAADSGIHADAPATMAEGVTVGGSLRGVAQDYLVSPEGGEITGQMKFITADRVLGDAPLKFTDLGLFGLTGRWSLFSKLEIAAGVDFLAKQPSYTDEKPWQDVNVALRSPLAKRVALAVSGGGGHLLGHAGMWTREAMMIEWKKPICCDEHEEIAAFDLQGGVDGLGLSAPHGAGMNAFLTELSTQTSVQFREPTGHWGAWLGIAYALPVQHSGADPTTGLAIDPQPRLDFHVGTVLSLEHRWDLFADFAVVDRGDVQDPATRLPILDGGFDQKQIVFGVTRHIDAPKHSHRSYDGDDGMRLSRAE